MQKLQGETYNKQFLYLKSDLSQIVASWSRSRTLETKHKVFSWRIDSRGNVFIKKKFRKNIFPRIAKISCFHLDNLFEFMQDMEWKALANYAAKLCLGTEEDGVGKFLYKLRPELSYAQLSSQLGAILSGWCLRMERAKEGNEILAAFGKLAGKNDRVLSRFVKSRK
ncbi:hypothetical protein [Methanosarcina sp.]|uniref:hypothetical protein n=1 Tax=Methanosarcina sp. TaxID=2213 RepID=UPI00298920D0|nr:hypothetical protein [Methanosarcina sp.]MDW5552262.1 hypothetical protein [Methanosarcina sp.]MDW5555092.1 hypothetical protein [Methanosarcina sp.]MDW5560779.1 hypothetical protein [Methanosarcina sp.]